MVKAYNKSQIGKTVIISLSPCIKDIPLENIIYPRIKKTKMIAKKFIDL